MSKESKVIDMESMRKEKEKEKGKRSQQTNALVLVLAEIDEKYKPMLDEQYSNAQYSTDSGIDIPLCSDAVTIQKGNICLVGLGVKAALCVAVMDKYEDGTIQVNKILRTLPYMLVARSSIYKQGLIVCNGFGVIDMEYRGELKMPLYATEDTTIEEGQRIAQVVSYGGMPIDGIIRCTHREFIKSFGNTKRGEGGFGSTGK